MNDEELGFEEFLDEIKKHQNNEWSKSVPIKKREEAWVTYYECYLTGDIGSPDNYNELHYVLTTALPGDIVNLHINTGGGYIDSAFQIVDAIKKSQAFVHAHIVGTVASAGTIVALSCDELEVAQFTQFMIHNYSTGTHGKGHEVMDYINFNDKTLKEVFKQIYKGFLTDKEIVAVLNGKDMWLNSEDVAKRWLKYQEAK